MSEQELASGQEREIAAQQHEAALMGLRQDYQMCQETAQEAGRENYPDYQAWLEREVLRLQSVHDWERKRIQELETKLTQLRATAKDAVDWHLQQRGYHVTIMKLRDALA